MTEPARPQHDAPSGLVDLVVLPGGAGAAEQAAPRRTGGATWARRVGAVLFWGVIQGAFLAVPPAVGLVINLAVAAGFVWWFAARPAVRADARRRATYRLRPVAPGARGWIVPAALAMVAVVVAALVVLPRFIPIPPDRTTFLDAYLKRPLGPAAVFVMVAVIAPLLEEFLFRGWMQRTLERRTTPWRAIAITAATFGLVHVDLFGLPLRVAFGVASGYLAWRTRSILPSVVLHGAYNGSLVILGGALPQVDERTLTAWARTDAIFYPALAGLALAGAALAWSVRRMGAASRRAGGTTRR